MFILKNVPLSTYSTMKLGGNTAFFSEINNRRDISEAVDWATERGLPIIMIGSGSNIIWKDEGFNGLVLFNKIPGYEVFEEDTENVYVTIGAGENWDSVVSRTVEQGLSGIEQLSLIPGTAGATPVQNVGAYGREISEVLTTIEAYDLTSKQFVTIPASDCDFGYRSSKFKTTDKRRYLISAVTLHLTRTLPQGPFYSSLDAFFAEQQIAIITPQAIRDAVIAIRSSKLPDPAQVANNGSFFCNPIIDQSELMRMLNDYPDLTYWQLDNGKAKISAAWLLERAGFKDYHDQATGMRTWPAQPLVLVNESAHSTADLLKFRTLIISTVERMFGIVLEQEPELLP